LYPAVISLFKWLFGVNGTMLYALLVFQHTLLAGSIIYLASTFRDFVSIFIMSAAAIAGVWGGSFAHMIATQALDLPFLLILCGVLFRYHARGWQLGLLPIFVLSALGLALSRHASIVLALVVPLYFMIMTVFALVAQSSRRSDWSSLAHTAVCCLAIGLVVVAANSLTRAMTSSTCSASARNCAYSIVGRAGCDRIAETYSLVPAEHREGWIAKETAGLPGPEAFALRTMAISMSKCWVEPHAAIGAAFPNENADRLMNSAFFHFLLSPDEFSIRQFLHHVRAGFYLNPESFIGALGYLFIVSTEPIPSVHDEARLRLNANMRVDGQVLTAMGNHPLIRLYDWYTRYCLLLVACISAFLVIVVERRPAVAALSVSLLSTTLMYAIAVSAVTLMLSQYLVPTTVLMYLLTGFWICTLFDRVAGILRPFSSDRNVDCAPAAAA
jgi:hypothetical protein